MVENIHTSKSRTIRTMVAAEKVKALAQAASLSPAKRRASKGSGQGLNLPRKVSLRSNHSTTLTQTSIRIG